MNLYEKILKLGDTKECTVMEYGDTVILRRKNGNYIKCSKDDVLEVFYRKEILNIYEKYQVEGEEAKFIYQDIGVEREAENGKSFAEKMLSMMKSCTINMQNKKASMEIGPVCINYDILEEMGNKGTIYKAKNTKKSFWNFLNERQISKTINELQSKSNGIDVVSILTQEYPEGLKIIDLYINDSGAVSVSFEASEEIKQKLIEKKVIQETEIVFEESKIESETPQTEDEIRKILDQKDKTAEVDKQEEIITTDEMQQEIDK